LAPQKGSTATSKHSGSVPTTGQRFEGWPLGRVRQPPQATRAPRPLLIRGSQAGPPKGSTAASEHAERGTNLGTFDTWPRLGLRSRDTLGHSETSRSNYVTESHQREASSPRTLSNRTGSGKSPAGTFGARFWATSRPLSNGARASTRITR
jgi:hypothetical protein